MERLPVNSSSLVSAGYDASSATLEVEFDSGNVYQYFDVPESVYEEFRNASSLGKFLNTNIKGSYRYARV